ncbi:MAG TPA: phage tail protein [Gaiellaceae bacterium]
MNPFPNHNFIVEIDGLPELAFDEVRLGPLRVDVIEYREGGDKTSDARLLPGRVHEGPALLRRGLSADSALYDWWTAVRDGQPGYEKNVSVTLLDASRQPAVRWLLHAAWPSRLEFGPLEGRGASVVVELLELQYRRLELASA